MKGFSESEEKANHCLELIICFVGFRAWIDSKCNDVRRFNSIICKRLRLSNFFNGITYDEFIRMPIAQEMIAIFNNHSKEANFSMSIDTFFHFKNSDKIRQTDRELLLAFLSVKSILGGRTYWLTNKTILLSRMSGNTKTKADAISSSLMKYTSRYHLGILLNGLFLKYGVSIYSDRGIRGFYISLKKTDNDEPDLEWLADVVEEKRKAKDNSLHKALKKIKSQRNGTS